LCRLFFFLAFSTKSQPTATTQQQPHDTTTNQPTNHPPPWLDPADEAALAVALAVALAPLAAAAAAAGAGAAAPIAAVCPPSRLPPPRPCSRQQQQHPSNPPSLPIWPPLLLAWLWAVLLVTLWALGCRVCLAAAGVAATTTPPRSNSSPSSNSNSKPPSPWQGRVIVIKRHSCAALTPTPTTSPPASFTWTCSSSAKPPTSPTRGSGGVLLSTLKAMRASGGVYCMLARDGDGREYTHLTIFQAHSQGAVCLLSHVLVVYMGGGGHCPTHIPNNSNNNTIRNNTSNTITRVAARPPSPQTRGPRGEGAPVSRKGAHCASAHPTHRPGGQ
jgi:hypothetical protein